MRAGIHVKFVMIPVFIEITGYSDKAVRRKIEEGIWRNGVHFRKSPDGHIHIDMPAYYAWVSGEEKLAA